MLICGNYYGGKIRRYYLTEDKVREEKFIKEIKDSITSLKSLKDDMVLVDLFTDFSNVYDKPIFFQVYKDRTFGMTKYYIVESGVRTKNGIVTYRQEQLAKEKALELFEKICVERKGLDAEWINAENRYDDKGKHFEGEDAVAKKALRLTNGFWSGELEGASAEFACNEALEKLVELSSDISYGDEWVSIHIDRDEYEKVKDIFVKLSHNPCVALEMGKVELYGKLGKPDYKKAYENFVHAAKIGSTEADYYLGQMYKYGLYVKKDMRKYIQHTKNVYEFYIENDAEYAMLCIGYVILELAKIEVQRENLEVGIEYCEKAKSYAISNSLYGSGIDDTLEDAVKFLYELIEFDENDIDLFDLFYLFTKPCKVRMSIYDKQIIAQSIACNGGYAVECNGKFFRDTKEFLDGYLLNGKRIFELYFKVKDMEVLR